MKNKRIIQLEEIATHLERARNDFTVEQDKDILKL